MSYPINYSFVTTKTTSFTEDDGSVKDFDILVLDREANNNYWKKIESFQKTLNSCTPEDLAVGFECWKMSVSFFDMAVSDIFDTAEDGMTILNIPLYTAP